MPNKIIFYKDTVNIENPQPYYKILNSNYVFKMASKLANVFAYTVPISNTINPLHLVLSTRRPSCTPAFDQ